MFKSSITRFLIVSLGVLMTGLLVAAIILALQAWNHFSLAGRIARLTSTDRVLFDALVTVRAQIPKDSTALLAEDDPRALIHDTYAEAARTVADALGSLRGTDIGDRSRLAGAIEAAWRRVTALEPGVVAQASLPRGERTLRAVEAWREEVHGMTEALSAASVAVENAVRIGDPVIAEMVQIRRTAWTIRDRYGLQCSMLRPNVDTSTPLDPSQLDSWFGNRAVYTAAWHSLDEFLLRPGISAAVRRRVDSARRKTLLAQERVDAIVGRFDRSGRPAVAGAEWTALCDGPFESILAIAQQAQSEADAHAQALRTASSRILLIAGIDLTSVIAFGAFAVVNVQRRLARPMKILIGAIARLGRREYDEPIPATGSPDELGSMSQALEALRLSALEAERLQQAMSRFTADASHQMRTPITVLRTHISVLRGLIRPDDAAYASLQDIQDASDRLQRLLIQLLKLARAEGSLAFDADSAQVDLREAIHRITEEYIPQALEAGIDLHFEADSRPFPIRADPIMLHEIFSNLIDNAIRYNDSGGSVVVRLLEEEAGTAVEIEDDGPGIPDSEREKVFTRFYRLSRDQGRLGSGLGLAIVQSLVLTMNAQIVLGPAARGRGLRVRVSMPDLPEPAPFFDSTLR